MSPDRVVVIGASAGGVGALQQVIEGLPGDFAAPVLVVLHVSPTHNSLLPQILARAGTLKAAEARNGETLRRGRVYVAPPDHHLMIDTERVLVTHGPRENHFRPSVDVLFRSAAYHFGSRAIGVVLSGALSDGSSGLFAIRRLGGVAVIQDPEEAAYSSMPLSAMRRVDIDYALPAAEIGKLLTGLLTESPRPDPLDAEDYRKDLKFDLDVARADSAFERGFMETAQPSGYVCPDCNGALFRIPEGKLDRFRCHTGHGFSTEALLTEYNDTVEGTLWQAVKSLQETAALLREAASRLSGSDDLDAGAELNKKADEVEKRLQALRTIALEEGGLRDDEPLEGS
jgi:two-component system, chemotaxis family, protein-glutamate methylesterase/glutaminase